MSCGTTFYNKRNQVNVDPASKRCKNILVLVRMLAVAHIASGSLGRTNGRKSII